MLVVVSTWEERQTSCSTSNGNDSGGDESIMGSELYFVPEQKVGESNRSVVALVCVLRLASCTQVSLA